MSRFIELAAPGYVEHQPSMHICLVGQCQLGHTYRHQSSFFMGSYFITELRIYNHDSTPNNDLVMLEKYNLSQISHRKSLNFNFEKVWELC